MKFNVDNKKVFELSETQKKILQHDLITETFEDDMQRRVRWVIEHKLKNTFARFKKEWEPKLKENKVEAIPLDEEKFAELVFKQPNYKNRSEREKDKKKDK